MIDPLLLNEQNFSKCVSSQRRSARTYSTVNILHGHDAVTPSVIYMMGKLHIGWRPPEGFTLPPSALHLIDLLLYFLQGKGESIKENLLCGYA